MNSKKINIMGNILVILSCAFIIRMIVVSDVDMQMLLTKTALPTLAVLAVLYACMVLSFAGMFCRLLRAFHGKEVPTRLVISIYCKSNIYKYLPGNIFHYLGRNQIAALTGIKHTEVISATVTEIFFVLFAGVFIPAVLTGKYALDWFRAGHIQVEFTVIILVLSVLAVILAVVLALIFGENFRNALRKYYLDLKYLGFKKVIAIQGFYLGLNMVNGVFFIVMLYSLGGELTSAYVLPVIGMFTFSWLVGYVTPGASAGLGVREVVMTTLLTGIVGMNIVIATVIAFRIVTVLGDIFAYLVTRKTKMGNHV